MPRVSAAHEREVRDRTVTAAARVFRDKGYHGATIADVVRESGLSVGAIYTYFSGKDALFRQSCDLIAARGLEELATRLAPTTSTAERLAAAIEHYVETIDDYDGEPGQVSLGPSAGRGRPRAGRPGHARPTARAARGGRAGAAARGCRRGRPAGVAGRRRVERGFTALLDGLLLQRIEAGPADRRRGFAAAAARPSATCCSRPRPRSGRRPRA